MFPAGRVNGTYIFGMINLDNVAMQGVGLDISELPGRAVQPTPDACLEVQG